MAEPACTLVVLRTSQLGACRAFYEAIGLRFVDEQHGRGPAHLAASIGGMVFELYPSAGGGPIERGSPEAEDRDPLLPRHRLHEIAHELGPLYRWPARAFLGPRPREQIVLGR